MCSLCNEVKKTDSQQALRLIARKMETAKSRGEFDHLSEVLDKLLGTEDKVEDEDLAKTWYEEKEDNGKE